MTARFHTRNYTTLTDATPEELADSKSSVMRDMQIVCSGCSMTRRCRRALGRQSEVTNYSAYCPNAPTIDALLHNCA